MYVQDKRRDISLKTDRKKREDSAKTQYRTLLNELRRDPALKNDGSFQALLQEAKRAVLETTKGAAVKETASLPREAVSRYAATPGRDSAPLRRTEASPAADASLQPRLSASPPKAAARSTAGTGRGADNPLYAQKRAELPYSDAQGERLKQAAQESRKAAEKAAAQLNVVNDSRRTDPALQGSTYYQTLLHYLRHTSDEAEKKRSEAETAYLKWETDRWNAKMSARYGNLRQNEDYTEKAAVNPIYAKGRDVRASALDYAYINDIDGFRNTYKARGALNGTGGYMAKYDYIRPEEMADYNYLVAAEGTASAKTYLRDYLDPILNQRNAEAANESLITLAKEHPVLASAVSVPGKLMSGVGTVDLAVQKLDRAITGSQRPIDWNSPALSSSSSADRIRETVSERIESPVGKFLYNTGMGIADSAAVYALRVMGLPGGVLLLGGSAAAQNARAVKQRGGSDEQALLYGLAAGTAEAIFEKLPLDNLLKMKTVGGVRANVLAVLRQSGIEATEEVATTIADTLADAVINGGRSEYEASVDAYIQQGNTRRNAQKKAAADWGEGLLLDALGGLLSGTLMGGTVNALQHAKSGDLRTRELGRLLQSEGAEDSVLEYACKTSAMDSDVFAQAFALESDRINGQPTDPEKLGRLYEDLAERDALALTDTRRQDIIETSGEETLKTIVMPIVPLSSIYFEDFTPPGSSHPVTIYTDGYAQVSKRKIEDYMRGKVEINNTEELIARQKDLEHIKNYQPSQFTSILKNELKGIQDRLHNCKRSRELSISLEIAGITDTPENNLFLAQQIISSAREATREQPIVNRLIQAPNCELRLESRWIIDKSGKLYLSTVILSPHNK